jgi:hypothetical protein
VKHPSPASALDEAIYLLEKKQTQQLQILREQFLVTYESLKPINLIKSTFHEATASLDTKKSLLVTVIESATDYLSKRVLTDTPDHSITKTIVNFLKFAITSVVSKYSETIVTSTEDFLARVAGPKAEARR